MPTFFWLPEPKFQPVQMCIQLRVCPVLIQFLPISFSHDTFTLAESQECGSETRAIVVQEEWKGMLHFNYTLSSLLDGPRSCL